MQGRGAYAQGDGPRFSPPTTIEDVIGADEPGDHDGEGRAVGELRKVRTLASPRWSPGNPTSAPLARGTRPFTPTWLSVETLEPSAVSSNVAVNDAAPKVTPVTWLPEAS